MLDAQELPVHPFTGLRAIGVLPSGRIVWPVKGAAEGDDGDDDDAGDGGSGDGDQGGDGGDQLGDAGKRALSEERRARRDAERARKAADERAAGLQAQLDAATAGKTSTDGDGQPDAEQIRRDADSAATKRANERVLRSEIRAAAAGKLINPADALKHLDLSDFEVSDDGAVDEQQIADAIADLLKSSPYLAAATAGRFQGTGDGGSSGRKSSSGPKQVTKAEFQAMTHAERITARKEGRLRDYLSGPG